MYRFVSSVNPVVLKRNYLAQYKVKLLQKKLDRLFNTYTDIRDAMPKGCTVKRLLTANFKYLTRVYCAFTGVLNTKTGDEKSAILKAFSDGGFNYISHKTKIANFLLDVNNGFEIYNCVYCDMEDVRSFVNARGKKIRRFETEHVLDKGNCPLVAFSLYNFVPSCGTCNGSNLKGTKTIGDTEAEMAKLSPTSEGYDCSNKVTFTVNVVNSNVSNLRPLEHIQDYEVGIEVKESPYEKTISLFDLKSRYNEQRILSNLLSWREFRRNNPDNIVKQFADIRHITFEEMFEEMFQLQQNRVNHEPMEKARRDVMMM